MNVTACELVELLLEMNVVNPKDIDIEINQLAARLMDPRAAKWFKRVPRNFIINIDQLIRKKCSQCGGSGQLNGKRCKTCKGTGKEKVPYIAKAEPRVEPTPTQAGGSKYYADPSARKPYADPSGWFLSGPGREAKHVPQEERGQKWGEEPMGGQPEACRNCGGTGLVKTVRHAETGQPVDVAVPYQEAEHASPEQKATFKKCRVCRGLGKRAKASLRKVYKSLSPELQPAYLKKISPATRRRMAVESWVNHMLEAEGYDPEKRTYATALHEPGVEHDIEQSFRPFKAAKAKETRQPGEPPTKGELQPWMASPEKEFHHFDPIQTRRRQLFGRMITLVNYLNHLTLLARKINSDKPKEAEQAREAEGMLERLRGYGTDDVEGFQDVMKAAFDFGTKVKEDPGAFTNDGQVIAAINDLQLRQTRYPQTVVAMARRGAGGEGGPEWDCKEMAKAEQWLGQGPIYFVDKNRAPYVMVWLGQQDMALDVAGNDITPEVAREIAPLFGDRQRFPPEEMIRARILAREVNVPERSREIMQLPDGWRLMQLMAPFDLAREGAMIQHCIGGGTYSDRLTAGTHFYYSLRDPNNKSMVTIELQHPNRVLQMKGFGNNMNLSAPLPALLRQIIQAQGWTVVGDEQALRDRR